MQWLVLRRRIASAGWWVLASIVGWVIGIAVFLAVGWFVAWAVGFAVVGAITGGALVRLLRQPAAEA
jgi:hypothetical protein